MPVLTADTKEIISKGAESGQPLQENVALKMNDLADMVTVEETHY